MNAESTWATLGAQRGAALRGPERVLVVRDLLRALLMRGHFADAPLPSETELQQAFSATRGTIRAVLAILADEGLVQRVRGTGTFVGAGKINHAVKGFQGLGGPGSATINVVVERKVIATPDPVAEMLHSSPGAPMLYLRRKTITRDGGVVSMFSSYLRLPMAEPMLAATADLSGEYYETVEHLIGRRILDDEVMIEAVSADAVTAEQMGTEIGAPLFHYERLLRVDRDEPLEFGVGFQRGDRIRLLRHRQRQ